MTMKMTLQPNERLLLPGDAGLRYTGRIGGPEDAPFFLYPCSSVALRFTGNTLRVAVNKIGRASCRERV